MFCRFCGIPIPRDSRFCPGCGRRQAPPAPEERPAWLRALGTPYPWAALLVVVFAGWILAPDSPGPDLSTLAMELELEGQSSAPEENLYRHYLSLVVENRGAQPVRDIPVELGAVLEPEQPVELVSDFRGGRFVLLSDGEARPLVLVLTDEIAASEKRRFQIDSVVTTAAPAEVTYTIRPEAGGEPLAVLRAPIDPGP